MAAELHWFKRSVNYVVGLIDIKPVFPNNSAATTTTQSSSPEVVNVYKVMEGEVVSPPQDSEAAKRLSDAYSDFSDIESNDDDDVHTQLKQLEEQFTVQPADLSDTLAGFKDKTLDDTAITEISSAILTEKNANPKGNNGLMQKKIFQALKPLNLSKEHLQALLNKIQTQEKLKFLVAPLTQAINDYEEKNRTLEMCEDIDKVFKSNPQNRSPVLDKIYEVIEQEITDQRPIATLRQALEAITLSDADSVNSNKFMFDPDLHPQKSTLQCKDLKDLVNKSLALTKTDTETALNTQMRDLSQKIVQWLENTEVHTSTDRKDVKEPTNQDVLKKDIMKSIQSLTTEFNPMTMAILLYYLDATIKKHEIEGSSRLAIFYKEIEKLLIDQNGNFKQEVATHLKTLNKLKASSLKDDEVLSVISATDHRSDDDLSVFAAAPATEFSLRRASTTSSNSLLPRNNSSRSKM